MKTFLNLVVSVLLLTTLVFAAGIDGKWTMERKMKTRDGEERTVKVTFNLKSDGGKITGTVVTMFGEMERSADIKEGKIDGAKFMFVTVAETPMGEMKTTYEGTVEGDTLKGESKREGGQKQMPSMPFEAKRAN
jgi:hypothetical protein